MMRCCKGMSQNEPPQSLHISDSASTESRTTTPLLPVGTDGRIGRATLSPAGHRNGLGLPGDRPVPDVSGSWDGAVRWIELAIRHCSTTGSIPAHAFSGATRNSCLPR